MNKRSFIFALAASAFLWMQAAPAKPGVRKFTQPDGSVISLNMIGDERFHTFVTDDGMPVTRTADGAFCYRTADGTASAVMAHDSDMRTAPEQEYVEANRDVAGVEQLSKRAMAKRAKSTMSAEISTMATQVPNNGSPRVPVLLLSYSDYDFRDGNGAKDTFTKFFEEGSTSARQYFVDQSNGKYTPEFDIYGPYKLSNKRVYYGGNNPTTGSDQRIGTMVGEGINGLNSQIDFSRYDNNGDGECDVVIVLYAGDGEASSYADDAEDAIWPCQWQLSASDYRRSLKLDGVKVDKFAVFNELYGGNLSQIDGIGTFCHEFSHCLGLPDFYDTEYGNHFGMGSWSLLDHGSYGNNGYTPVGYSAYEKAFMGWITLEDAKKGTAYTLPKMNLKSATTDRAIKITNPKDKNEYYILENRAKQGWDQYLPAAGLLITHVTYNQTAWDYNYVNNYDMQRMTIIPADNSLKVDAYTYMGQTIYQVNEADQKGDAWPYGNATELTDESKPAAKVNTGNYMGQPVTDITRNSDGTVSFRFMCNEPMESPVVNEASNVTSDGFTVSWKHNPPVDVTYTLEVSPKGSYDLVDKQDMTTGSTDWEIDGYAAFEEDTNGDTGLRMGSASRTGGVITSSYNTGSYPDLTVRLNAAAYGTDTGVQISVTVYDVDDNELDGATINVEGTTPKDYVAHFEIDTDTEYYITIGNKTKKKRAYLYNAAIYNGDATTLTEGSRAEVTGDADYMKITGITGTSYNVTGLTPGLTYQYRVMAVPVSENSEVAESYWSLYGQVTLASSAIDNVIVDAEDSNAPVEMYTITGVKVNPATAAPGIYIRRQGRHVEKILVK